MKQVYISARQILDQSIYCLNIDGEKQVGVFHTSAIRSCLFATYHIKNIEESEFHFENERISNYIKEKLPQLKISNKSNQEIFEDNLEEITSKIYEDFKYYRIIDKSLFRTMDF